VWRIRWFGLVGRHVEGLQSGRPSPHFSQPALGMRSLNGGVTSVDQSQSSTYSEVVPARLFGMSQRANATATATVGRRRLVRAITMYQVSPNQREVVLALGTKVLNGVSHMFAGVARSILRADVAAPPIRNALGSPCRNLSGTTNLCLTARNQ